MEVSHTPVDKPTPRDVWTALNDLPQRVNSLLKKYESSHACEFEDFERQLHALFAQTECAVTEEALARHDVDLPFVFINGEMHRRACRCAQTYLTAAGAVSVTRTLYRTRRGERAVAALERKVGIVQGYWTPLAARQGAMLVSHLTPRDAEEVLATLGHMQPSKSSLDRLPKALSARWEAQRETFETTVREATVEVPDAARAVVVSLERGDGADARRIPRGGLCDGVAGRWRRGTAAQRAHGPDAGVEQGDAEDDGGRRGRGGARKAPGPHGGQARHGAKDNWTFLTRALPAGVELIDFYHAVEHLKDAFDTAHGTDSPKAAAQFKKYRHLLRHEPDGVNSVIRALLYLRSKSPGNERIAQVLGYFRGNRHRMGYADAKAQGLPIGSGVVEAACKTLVTERLKRSGMRWGPGGGQAILTLRSLVQSRRFDYAWSLLAQSYRTQVSCPDNVVPLRRANIH